MFVCRNEELMLERIRLVIELWIAVLGQGQIGWGIWLVGLSLFQLILFLSGCKPKVLSKL